uniref:Uncharacterized protein n=1 Tax=Setaria italica TaxID=4555 RepID=K3Z1X9_SETIT
MSAQWPTECIGSQYELLTSLAGSCSATFFLILSLVYCSFILY